jgi:hypothetical protein
MTPLSWNSSQSSLPSAVPFTDAAEHRDTAVLQRDVVDQLHDDDGLADAGAAEQADLAALAGRARAGR